MAPPVLSRSPSFPHSRSLVSLRPVELVSGHTPPSPASCGMREEVDGKGPPHPLDVLLPPLLLYLSALMRLSSSVPCASMAAIGGRRIPCSGQQGRAATGGGAAAMSPDEQVVAGGSTAAEHWSRVKQVEQDGACGVLRGNLHNEPPTLTACRASTGQICQVQMRRLRGLLRSAQPAAAAPPLLI
ncbi:uncharacterized protein [Lolium perenne]|uniref:uncharacterized protein n=1 Tax=Lolium perenne TaxID=4522 RepID=UPI0021EA782A